MGDYNTVPWPENRWTELFEIRRPPFSAPATAARVRDALNGRRET